MRKILTIVFGLMVLVACHKVAKKIYLESEQHIPVQILPLQVGYTNDFAKLFTASQIDSLNQRMAAYEQRMKLPLLR